MAEIVNKKRSLPIKTIPGIFISLFFIFGSSFSSLLMAQSQSENHLKVLNSEEQSLVVELKTDAFQTELIEQEGQTYQKIIIPDMTQRAVPGEPQVPMCGSLVGIPSLNGVSVQILDADYETRSGYHLCPAPGIQVSGDNWNNIPSGDIRQTFALNDQIYGTNDFYPDSIVELGYTGYMRDQPVAQIQCYPVQYNPATGEVRFYRRILARITWSGPSAEEILKSEGLRSAKSEELSYAYEDLLKGTILNYDALKRPSVTRARLPRSEPEGETMAETSGTITAGAPAATLKIGVTEDGIYKLTYSNLTHAGLNLNGLDPRTIKLSNRGAEIPIYVHGEDDGVFNISDYILFYGTAINDIYTSKNVYWLTSGGGTGQRMKTFDGTPTGSAPVADQFPATLHAEKDTYYWQTMPNGVGQDHWFWDDKLTAPKAKNYSLTLNNLSVSASTATVRVRLKGRTDVSKNPDHHTKIYLNTTEIDNQLWNGMNIFDHEVSVSHSLLNEGANTVRVESVGDTGAPVDQVFVNWIEISCFGTYVAEDNELRFGAPNDGTFQFEVADFGSNDIEVFDVTDPASVALIANTSILDNGGNYTLKFEDTAESGTRYLAQVTNRRKPPASIEIDQKSYWKSAKREADLIIITHEDFYASAQRLAKHRRDSGLRVAPVKITDIYDEFNYGIFNPQAIRDFLSYAYNHWVDPKPTYVLLVGDACQDFKDNLKTGTLNYVPTQLVETDILGETPSDNWFVLLSGNDILPDMFIGRLCVDTKSQADGVVDKIISYEQSPPKNTWSNKALFVADDDDSSFETMSNQLAGLLPDDYKANKVYVSKYTSGGNPTKDIIKHIDAGSLLVNYSGHGSVDRWGLWNGGDSIFSLSDIQSLNNTNKFPVVTVADCLNGFFTGTKPQVSIAEQFQRLPGKSAVAVWSPTALSYTSGHQILMSEFYKAIFQNKQYGLGAATTAAKIATYGQDPFWGELVETFVLFCDPVTQLGSSLTLLSPNGGESIASGETFTIQWTAPQAMEKFNLRYSLD
ncbi:MAG: hypothetical protein AYP45_17660, partial [Candidatus Brocadia carolinensis]